VAEGRVAIVTGGGRGIGRAVALRLAGDGFHLSLWARSTNEIEAVAEEAQAMGGDAAAVPCDVSDWSSVERACAETIARFGRVDALINNAGVGGPRARVADVDPRRWAETIDIDLTGQFYCMRAVLPHMLARGSGKIVNVTGGGAGEPYPGNSAYAAAKTALVRLSETVAVEVRDSGIQVNAVTPGLVVTRLTQDALKEMERTLPERADTYRRSMENDAFPPEAGAELIAYLCSPESDGLTGRWLTVHDVWRDLVRKPKRLMDEDLYVLRRTPR
jgi:NAD(P)-dependent dehydrogenase (short-subunit alcohol dehydrogenase family)